MRYLLCSALVLIGAPLSLDAQTMPTGHQHTPGMVHTDAPAARPTEAGQAAFATISEVVRLLEADPATDWSKVDIEALRQHLMDMDDVTMRAVVQATTTPGGLAMDVTGTGRVAGAIQRMVTAHAPMLEGAGPWRAMVAPVAGGVRFTVVARDLADAATTTRIRGLGFLGLMTQGAHHAEHHLLIARGLGDSAHRH